MSWKTFWSWRGAHHGKATRRAVQAQSAQSFGIERARWAVEHPGAPLPEALLTTSEKNSAMLRGGGEPWHPVVWWTVVVLAGLCGLTVIGLVVTAALAPAIVAHNPYRASGPMPGRAPTRGQMPAHFDPPTRPLPTVPDPCREYVLPREHRADHTPRDLVASSRGRHAR